MNFLALIRSCVFISINMVVIKLVIGSYVVICTEFTVFSLCVQYKKVDSAVATRARLHGLKWPSTNSKFLAVDYLTPEEASRISEGQLEIKLLLEGGASEPGKEDEGGEAAEMETADTKQGIL